MGILGLVFLSVSSLAFAGNTITYTDTAILIDVTAELQSVDVERVTDGRIASRARAWEDAANRFWNPTPAFRKDGRELKIRFHFKGLKSSEPRNPEAHAIEVSYGVLNSSGFYSAYVAHSPDPRGPHGAGFPVQIFDSTLVHEVGHFLNLVDEYQEYATEKEIPSVELRNGQSLVPGTVSWIPNDKAWLVSFGPERGLSGVMGMHTEKLLPYYFERILESFK